MARDFIQGLPVCRVSDASQGMLTFLVLSKLRAFAERWPHEGIGFRQPLQRVCAAGHYVGVLCCYSLTCGELSKLWSLFGSLF